MLSKAILYKEIETLPDEFTREMLDFVRFLKEKYINGQKEITLLSESSLRKDWLSPEEDEAWQNL